MSLINNFEHSFYIGDKLYNVYIDSSHDEWKRILINNREVINEKYTLALNRKAYIIYYPIDLSGHELVISIDDNPLLHVYNLYVDNISVIDGARLDEKLRSAENILKSGFTVFFKKNWLTILKDNFLYAVGTILGGIVLLNFTLKDIFVRILLSILIIPLALPLFVAGEWFHYKNIVKKYNGCFRPKIFYDRLLRLP